MHRIPTLVKLSSSSLFVPGVHHGSSHCAVCKSWNHILEQEHAGLMVQVRNCGFGRPEKAMSRRVIHQVTRTHSKCYGCQIFFGVCYLPLSMLYCNHSSRCFISPKSMSFLTAGRRAYLWRAHVLKHYALVLASTQQISAKLNEMNSQISGVMPQRRCSQRPTN